MVLTRPLVAGIGLGLLLVSPVLAQEAERASDLEVLDEQLDRADLPSDEDAPIEPDDQTPLGIVRELEILGAENLSRSVLRRQLAFKLGDTLTPALKARSIVLLRRLRLLSRIEVTESHIEAPGTEPGATPNLKVVVQLSPSREYNALPIIRSSEPYLIGATASHRNPLGDATEFAATFYAQGGAEHYQLTVTEPQLFGGHHVGVVNLLMEQTPYSVRTADVERTNENYNLEEQSFGFTHRTYLEDVEYWIGAEYAQSDVTVSRGTRTGDLLNSGTNIADGRWLKWTGGLRQWATKGSPWVREGYTWSLRTTQSFEALASEASYGTYRLDASGYFPLGSDDVILALGTRIGTSSGHPPHYEAPTAGGRVRGYTGLSYASRSALTAHAELRFPLYDDIAQGIVFYDVGRGYDSMFPGIDDMESGYGVGVRVRTGEWLPIDYVLSGDIGFSGDEYEIRLGLGQWF